MPLSESIEKPLIADRAGSPIAVFFNSYARLPEHFFARLSPTPVAKPHLIKFNESLASAHRGPGQWRAFATAERRGLVSVRQTAG